MEIIRIDFSSKEKMPPSVLCLGNFDGVHIGHAALLRRALEIGRASGRDDIVCGVLTFSPPPSELLLDEPPPRIVSFEEKMSLFEAAGIVCVYVVDFAQVMKMTPERFIKEVLFEKCNCIYAVCGYNFRFGSGGAGDSGTLGRALGGRISVVDPVEYCGLAVSSTAIRRAVAGGEMERAAGMLGRPFSLTAPVIHGHAMGREIGFATANQLFPERGLVPASGVYVSSCGVGGRVLPAVSDIGRRPTFVERGSLSCETHIINFSGDLYGREITVYFHKYLRPDIKFENKEKLIEAIKGDVSAALGYFSGLRLPLC